MFRKLVHRLKPGGPFAVGEVALERGDYDAAAEAFEAALRDDPSWTNTWFNLGLAHKLRRDWYASMVANKRAAELDARNDAAFWNCGVAATAIRDWTTARWAWKGIGIDVGPGDGPPDHDSGPSPIRLNPEDGGEVVWGRRIDPCRIRIDSVPLPESGHGWHDVVLHDVVPHGERTAWGQAWPVFDELLRMDPSGEPTWQAELTLPGEADEAALHERFAEARLGIEDWSAIRMLCRQCSESSPHAHADASDPTPIPLTTRRFGLAGSRDPIERSLYAWAAEAEGRAFGGLEAIEPPPG